MTKWLFKGMMFLTTFLLALGPFWGFAQDGGEKPARTPGGSDLFFPLILTFGVIYFLILRPQQKRERNLQTKLKAVEKGDEITTKGGLIGKVTNVADKILTIEIADRTRVKVNRDFIQVIEKQKS